MTILLVMLILLELYRIIKYEIKENSNKIEYKKMYKPRKYLITLNELKFYKILLQVANELDLVVFAQVSLYNILQTQEKLDYKTKEKYFRRIASKSIDFVLADPNNCRIRLCIELDDSTHKRPERIKRDKFINDLFKELEISLLRYPIYNIYYKEALKNKIQENMQEHFYIK